jgi:diguanylate cyclase (GGDEF)-like protein
MRAANDFQSERAKRSDIRQGGPTPAELEKQALVRFIGILLLLNRQREREAMIDPLTGLRNGRQFEIDLDREFRRARRHFRPFSLAVIDVDELKLVNDTHGHAAGDAMLRHVARVMNGSLRESDTLFRLHGDEFSALLPETSAQGAQKIVQRIDRAVRSAAVEFDGHKRSPRCSIGCVTFCAKFENPRDMFAAADFRMYAEKHAHRNDYVRATPMQKRVKER